MIVIAIVLAGISVIGAAKTVQSVSTDGFGRVPTRHL